MFHLRRAALTAALLVGIGPVKYASAQQTQQLIQNGGFENGSLAGWTTQDQAGSSGTFIVTSATSLPSPANPFRPTIGPSTGTFYAVTDDGGSGSHALLQSFTVAPSAGDVVLTFDMFVDNYAGTPATPATLDDTTVPNQQARVDLLTSGAGAFDTGAGVLHNFYDTTDPVTDPLFDNPHPYTHYSFDITTLVGSGGTFQLRFAGVNNQDTLYQGIDNVSIVETLAAPEPSALVAFAVCTLGLGLLRFKACRRRLA